MFAKLSTASPTAHCHYRMLPATRATPAGRARLPLVVRADASHNGHGGTALVESHTLTSTSMFQEEVSFGGSLTLFAATEPAPPPPPTGVRTLKDDVLRKATPKSEYLLTRAPPSLVHYLTMPMVGDGHPSPFTDDLASDGDTIRPQSVHEVTILPDSPEYFQSQMQDLDTIAGYVTSLASVRIAEERPQGYDINNHEELMAALAARAKHTFSIYNGELGDVLVLGQLSGRTFEKETTTADLHLDFLKVVFDGFQLAEGDLRKVDDMLKSFLDAVSNLNVSWEKMSDKSSLMLVVKSFNRIPIPDMPDIKVYESRLRFFNFALAQDSWQVALKRSTVEHIKVSMSWVDLSGNINAQAMNKWRNKMIELGRQYSNDAFNYKAPRVMIQTKEA